MPLFALRETTTVVKGFGLAGLFVLGTGAGLGPRPGASVMLSFRRLR